MFAANFYQKIWTYFTFAQFFTIYLIGANMLYRYDPEN